MNEEKDRDYLLPDGSLLTRMPSMASLRNTIAYSRRLERLWTFVEEHYSDADLHLDDAARYCSVSRDHLNLLLRHFADTTFHDLLSRYRIEKSLEMLHEKNYTLTEIYSRCGFNSPNTFSRQFKKWAGCLPSDYKKRLVMSRLVASKAEMKTPYRFLEKIL